MPEKDTENESKDNFKLCGMKVKAEISFAALLTSKKGIRSMYKALFFIKVDNRPQTAEKNSIKPQIVIVFREADLTELTKEKSPFSVVTFFLIAVLPTPINAPEITADITEDRYKIIPIARLLHRATPTPEITNAGPMLLENAISRSHSSLVIIFLL